MAVALEKKLATRVFARQEWTIVSLHGNEIVKFDQDTIILDSCGWETVTTKRRINQAAQRFLLPIRVWQTNHVWFVYYLDAAGRLDPDSKMPFYDGMRISRDPAAAQPIDEEAAAAAAAGREYNGWPNRATWNVALWLNNEEPLYRAYRAHRAAHGDFTPKSAFAFCLRLWRNGRTPDGDLITRANWVRLAEALNED